MKITAPVAGFSGEVVGVAFSGGVGHSDDPWLLAYFGRHGYGIEPDPDDSPAEEAPTEEAPQPRATRSRKQ